MNLRALSVRRPWANLLFAGKSVENRTWTTRHRGELVIHAGQSWEATGAALAAELDIAGFDTPQSCPTGYLGFVQLVDVHPANGCCAPWGQHGEGIYHWVIADPTPFAAAIPGSGRLGLFRPPETVPMERPPRSGRR